MATEKIRCAPKLLRISLLVLVYLLTVTIVNIIHNLFFNVGVVFYSAILDSLIALLPICIFRNKIVDCNLCTRTDMTFCLIIMLLLGYIYAISVPTVIDRSLSIYILEKIESQGGEIRLGAIEDLIKNDYVIEHRLAEVRLTEQLESGTLVIDDNCVKLTKKGHMVALITEYIRQNLLPKNRLLMNEYTNRLTTPINKSVVHPDRNCGP